MAATLSYGVSRDVIEAAIVDRAVECTRRAAAGDQLTTWREHLAALEYGLVYRLVMVAR